MIVKILKYIDTQKLHESVIYCVDVNFLIFLYTGAAIAPPPSILEEPPIKREGKYHFVDKP